MPRKFIRRLLPDLTAALKHPSMRWAAPLIRDPNIMHLNRQSVSLAVFIGVLIAFLPIPGQTFVAAGLAIWWGANLPISIRPAITEFLVILRLAERRSTSVSWVFGINVRSRRELFPEV